MAFFHLFDRCIWNFLWPYNSWGNYEHTGSCLNRIFLFYFRRIQSSTDSRNRHDHYVDPWCLLNHLGTAMLRLSGRCSLKAHRIKTSLERKQASLEKAYGTCSLDCDLPWTSKLDRRKGSTSHLRRRSDHHRDFSHWRYLCHKVLFGPKEIGATALPEHPTADGLQTNTGSRAYP